MIKQEIIKSLVKTYADFSAELEIMNENEFKKAHQGKWDASQHADHLNRSLLPLIIALRLPRFFIRTIFGNSKSPSKSYIELVATYKNKIFSGSKAVYPFIPSKYSFKSKAGLLKKLDSNIKTLVKLIDNIQEAQLDQILLPHPILEKITLREMLYFTIYHAEHHKKLMLDNLE